MPNHEEPHVVSALIEVCQRVGTRCIVQVGAEDGYEAMMCASACGGRAIAIEGDERCEPCDTSISYHYAVIGATDSETAFHVCAPNTGLSSALKRDEALSVRDVNMQRLDTFCRQIGARPDALIIDTEGTTLDVLEGADGIMDGLRLVYAECQTSTLRPGVRLVAKVNEFLVARGFTQHTGLPTYDAGGQGNYTWTRMP